MIMTEPSDVQIRKIYDAIEQILGRTENSTHPFCVLIPYRPANSTKAPDIATIIGNMPTDKYVALVALAAERALEDDGNEDQREIPPVEEQG